MKSNTENETLILKEIISGEDSRHIIHFDSNGKYLFMEDTRFDPPRVIMEYTYNEGLLIRHFNVNGFTTDFQYDSNNLLIGIETLFQGNITVEYTISLEYQNNTILGTASKDGIQEYNVIYTFEGNSHKKLNKYEVFDFNNNQKVFEEVYTYSSNNLIDSTVLVGDNSGINPLPYTYDNAHNPFSEGNHMHYLNHIISAYHFGSLKVSLGTLSSNNLTSPINTPGRVEFDYNEMNYPLQETTYNENNEIVHIRTFKYY
jgi:YD repeat-containing protein